MVPRKQSKTTVMTSGNVRDSLSARGIERTKSNPTASSSCVKRRQTSLRNFFGTAGKAKTTAGTIHEKHDENKPPVICPLTPPTPVSPQTPLTPPTAQEAQAFPTPPSPSAKAVFKKAKRETTVQVQNDYNNTEGSTTRNHVRQKKALEQTYLDLGQGDFGKRTICTTCGMLYVHGLTEDSKQHSRICKDYKMGVPFCVPQARVVASHSNGSIVEVRHSDSYTLRSKVKRVKEIVDRDLGFVPSDEPAAASPPQTRIAYLFINNKRVVGMAMAEIIPHAYLSHNALERSSTPQKALAGIHQLWVHAKFRKQGIATRLVDAARAKLVFGLTVPKTLLAFSSPTEAGARFARNYMMITNGGSSAAQKSTSVEILVYECS